MTRPNLIRAEWASKAIDTFAGITGSNLDVERDDAVADLLTSVMNYCQAHGLSYRKQHARAARNFKGNLDLSHDNPELRGTPLKIKGK